MEPKHGHRNPSAGQLDPFGDLGNDTHFGVLSLVSRHQQDLLVRARVERKSDGHSRKHNHVIKRNERKSCHKTNHMHIVDDVNY